VSSTYGGVTAGRRDHCRHYVIAPAIGCEHCIEDAKILEEKIEAVVAALERWPVENTRQDVVDALRELVREVRR
jgi:hypothetical protein